MSWLKHHPLSSLGTASQAGSDSDDKTNDSRDCSDTESTYSNECASNCGYGTDDTLTVTKVLEQHGIPCCLVGIAALIFYGAGRVRDVSHSGALSLFKQRLIYLSHVAGLGDLRSNRAHGPGSRAITIRTILNTVSPSQTMALLQSLLSYPHIPPVQKQRD